jgi:hypothetical protein
MSDMDDGATKGDGGFGRPPAGPRFAKGQSGNPKGRPRGSRSLLPYDVVLGRKVTVREDGAERRVTAAEAFLLHITKQGLEGDGAAARAAMAAIEQARASRPAEGAEAVHVIVRQIVTPGSVNAELERLNMATKLDRYRPTARMKIEPWLVEAALARLGERRLSRDEQAEVVAATRMPGKVGWPLWWEVTAPLTNVNTRSISSPTDA